MVTINTEKSMLKIPDNTQAAIIKAAAEMAIVALGKIGDAPGVINSMPGAINAAVDSLLTAYKKVNPGS